MPVELKIGRSYRRDVVGKATSGRRGLWALMSWGPEKMLIRCCKESHHPAEWPLGLWLSSPGERERHNADGHKFWGQNISVMFGLSSLSHTNLEQPFRTLAIKWEVNIFIKKSSCVFVIACVCYHCVGMYPSYICIFLHESAYDNATATL